MTGARQLNARLDAIGKAPPTMLDRLGLLIVRGAKQRVARKTAQTGRTIRIASRSAKHVQVSAGGAAVFLEEGTRAHDILPRRAKALRFASSPGGRRLSGRPRKGADVTFAKRVRHPGTRKQPFMRPAVEEAVRKSPLKDQIVSAWNKAG